MIKITIEPGKPAKILKPKREFYLDKIKLTFKIAGLSVLSSTTDYLFELTFLSTSGDKYTVPINLYSPYYYLVWELNLLDDLNFKLSNKLFNEIRIFSAPTNAKAVILEIDFESE